MISTAAALIGSTLIGVGTTALASSKASKTANQNAEAAKATAAENAQVIRDTQAANAGIITGTQEANTGLANVQRADNAAVLTGAQGANDSLFTGAEGQAADAINTAHGENAALYAPYSEIGAKATSAISALLGLGGDVEAQNAAFENWRNSTGYQFNLKAGADAVNSQKSAQGLTRSGSALKALQDRGTQIGNGYFQGYMGNLTGQQQVGLQAASALAGNNNNRGSALANLSTTTAANRASNNTNATNALVGSNSGLTSTLINGNANAAAGLTSNNTSTANALLGNNTALQGNVAGYNTQAANAQAGALSSFGGNLVSTLGYAYGAQQPKTGELNSLRGLY